MQESWLHSNHRIFSRYWVEGNLATPWFELPLQRHRNGLTNWCGHCTQNCQKVCTGDVPLLQRSPRIDSRKLDEHHELYILGLVAENPGVTLREIYSKIEEAINVSVSGPTVCRVLHRNNFTRKILQVAKQRSVDFRARFMSHALQFPRRFFVWVD